MKERMVRMSNIISYRQAINEALTEEMERDSGVFIYGIDVGDHDRIFKTTAGLSEKFEPIAVSAPRFARTRW